MMKFDNKSITNFSQMFHLACYGMQFSIPLSNDQENSIPHYDVHPDVNHPTELYQFKKNVCYNDAHNTHVAESTTTRISTYVMLKHVPKWLKWFLRSENLTKGPFHEGFFHHNSKSLKFGFNVYSCIVGYHIGTKVSTCHDSTLFTLWVTLL